MIRIPLWQTAALAAALFASSLHAGEAVPPLGDLRKPVEEVQVEVEEEPILPSPVSPSRRIMDTARICPAGAVWYVAAPDSARLAADWNSSPPGVLFAEPAMTMTVRNNRFGMNHLFGDLPEAMVTPERVDAVAAMLELCRNYAKVAEKMATAVYINDEGEVQFLFVFDVGLDRIPAFEAMTEWETAFFVANPGSDVVRGDHSGNFLDVWRLKNVSGANRRGEIVAGFAENMVIVSNDSVVAARSLDLLGGGESVADSNWGQRLAASISASTSADIVGYLRMDALLKGLEPTPLARESVSVWADYLGYGGDKAEAVYYGLQFAEDGTRETFLLPTSGPEVSASLVELLAKRLRRAERWTTPSVIPYQPNPAFYFAAMLDGRQLGSLLRQERRLFGLSDSDPGFQVPEDARRLFTNEMTTLLTGEIGLAFFPGADAIASWLMVLPCTSNPETLLRRSESMVDRAGAVIHSQEIEWRTKVSWSVATATNFRRLNGHYLLVASQGDLLVATLDQLVSGSSFANNKDYSKAIQNAEADQGMLFYYNIPEVLVREYPNLSHLMRTLYPRSSGLNSRPPLAMLRRFAKGMLGVIAPPPPDGSSEFTRVTIQAPLPALGMIAAGTVLRFPMTMRLQGRQAMEKSRDNMRTLWLRMQLYSSRFGHFPDSLEDLAAELRVSMTDEEIRSLLTAPSALSRLTPAEAVTGSYRYLSGVTPNDEPDIPLIYEAQPWSHDFAGMHPINRNRAPSETGDYEPYRQFIRLDGTVVTVTEKRFQERVVPRLVERE